MRFGAGTGGYRLKTISPACRQRQEGEILAMAQAFTEADRSGTRDAVVLKSAAETHGASGFVAENDGRLDTLGQKSGGSKANGIDA